VNDSDDGDESSGSAAAENFRIVNFPREFSGIYVALLEFRINYTPAAMKLEVAYENDLHVKMFQVLWFLYGEPGLGTSLI
jgi:hypothetical protein